MNAHRFLVALTAINLGLLAFLLVRAWPGEGTGGASVLRGSGLEIVDNRGRVRASIQILPAGSGTDGKATGETVLLRLINRDGQPSTKISTSDKAAGLSFVGGDDESYVILQADGAKTSLDMVEPGGRRQVTPP